MKEPARNQMIRAGSIGVILGRATDIAVMFAALAGGFPEKLADQLPAAAIGRHGIGMKRFERLQALFTLVAAEFHTRFFNEAAVDLKIVRVPKKNRLGGETIPACASSLLGVIVQTDEGGVMDHQPDIGDVHAQTERVGANHDRNLAVRERLQTRSLVVAFSVIVASRISLFAKIAAKIFHTGDCIAVDDAPTGFTFFEKMTNFLSFPKFDQSSIAPTAKIMPDLDYGQTDIVSGYSSTINQRMMKVELRSDGIRCSRCCSRGKRANDRARSQTVNKVPEAVVVLTEAGTLLDDAMRLVDEDRKSVV